MVEEAISFWTEIQRYENMLAADPGSYCFVPLSDLYRKLGLLDDAISVAQKGTGRHPDYPEGFFALGAAHSAKGEKERARAALERAVSLKGDHVGALKLLGQLYVEGGEIDRAKAVLAQALRHDPEDTETELLLRSIAPGEALPEPEEEIIEDVEVIEDLEELEEEPLPPMAPEIAASVAQGRPLEQTAKGEAPGKGEPAAFLEESSDFWGLGMPAEGKGAQPAEPEEDEFSGFDASDELESAAVEPAPSRAAATEGGRRDPLSTATLAELYVSQGHLAKALGIYQQLAGEDPGNQSYGQRVLELRKLSEQQSALEEPAPEAPPVKEPPVREPPVEKPPVEKPPVEKPPVKEPPVEKPPVRAQVEAEQAKPEPLAAGDLESVLTGWLQNIRRRRDGV